MAKHILVTGASRGLGFHLTRLLVHQGHKVLAVARSQEGLLQLKQDCSGMKGQLILQAQDINNVEELVQEVERELQTVDVLINNAAAFLKKEFTKLSRDELQRIYNTNVFTPLLLVQQLLPLFNSHAHIVNISSVGGVQGSLKFKELLPYSSSKGALNIITECLAAELDEHLVYCNALALGSVSTQMFKKAFPGFSAGASPNEMAKYIAHFALNAAPLINGKVISVSHTNP